MASLVILSVTVPRSISALTAFAEQWALVDARVPPKVLGGTERPFGLHSVWRGDPIPSHDVHAPVASSLHEGDSYHFLIASYWAGTRRLPGVPYAVRSHDAGLDDEAIHDRQAGEERFASHVLGPALTTAAGVDAAHYARYHLDHKVELGLFVYGEIDGPIPDVRSLPALTSRTSWCATPLANMQMFGPPGHKAWEPIFSGLKQSPLFDNPTTLRVTGEYQHLRPLAEFFRYRCVTVAEADSGEVIFSAIGGEIFFWGRIAVESGDYPPSPPTGRVRSALGLPLGDSQRFRIPADRRVCLILQVPLAAVDSVESFCAGVVRVELIAYPDGLFPEAEPLVDDVRRRRGRFLARYYAKAAIHRHSAVDPYLRMIAAAFGFIGTAVNPIYGAYLRSAYVARSCERQPWSGHNADLIAFFPHPPVLRAVWLVMLWISLVYLAQALFWDWSMILWAAIWFAASFLLRTYFDPRRQLARDLVPLTLRSHLIFRKMAPLDMARGAP